MAKVRYNAHKLAANVVSAGLMPNIKIFRGCMMVDLLDDAACRLIYLKLKPRRNWWPATYEEAMQNPLVSRVIKLYARHHQHAPEIVSQRVVKLRDWPPMSAPVIDGKSRAAGEKDD